MTNRKPTPATGHQAPASGTAGVHNFEDARQRHLEHSVHDIPFQAGETIELQEGTLYFVRAGYVDIKTDIQLPTGPEDLTLQSIPPGSYFNSETLAQGRTLGGRRIDFSASLQQLRWVARTTVTLVEMTTERIFAMSDEKQLNLFKLLLVSEIAKTHDLRGQVRYHAGHHLQISRDKLALEAALIALRTRMAEKEVEVARIRQESEQLRSKPAQDDLSLENAVLRTQVDQLSSDLMAAKTEIQNLRTLAAPQAVQAHQALQESERLSAAIVAFCNFHAGILQQRGLSLNDSEVEACRGLIKDLHPKQSNIGYAQFLSGPTTPSPEKPGPNPSATPLQHAVPPPPPPREPMKTLLDFQAPDAEPAKPAPAKRAPFAGLNTLAQNQQPKPAPRTGPPSLPQTPRHGPPPLPHTAKPSPPPRPAMLPPVPKADGRHLPTAAAHRSPTPIGTPVSRSQIPLAPPQPLPPDAAPRVPILPKPPLPREEPPEVEGTGDRQTIEYGISPFAKK